MEEVGLQLLKFALRTTVVFVVLLVLIRLMGKREVGQLSPFDFTVAVTIGSIAASPLVRSDVSVIITAVSMFSFASLHIAVSLLGVRYPRVERWLSGTPCYLIDSGSVVENNLRRSLVNVEELLSLLRLNAVTSLHDVEAAILEPNGELSIIRRSQASPVEAGDLGVSTPYRGMSTLIIDDGDVKKHELVAAGLDEQWLSNELSRRGIADPTSVLLAVLDTTGEFYVQPKSSVRKEQQAQRTK